MCLLVSDKTSTLPNGNPNGEFNISLKDNSDKLSQISSNDETSLNNNINRNKLGCLTGRLK